MKTILFSVPGMKDSTALLARNGMQSRQATFSKKSLDGEIIRDYKNISEIRIRVVVFGLHFARTRRKN